MTDALKKLRDFRKQADALLTGVRNELKSKLQDAVNLIEELKQDGVENVLGHEDFADIRAKLGIGTKPEKKSRKGGKGSRRTKAQVAADRKEIEALIKSDGPCSIEHIRTKFKKANPKAKDSAIVGDVLDLYMEDIIVRTGEAKEGKYSVKK